MSRSIQRCEHKANKQKRINECEKNGWQLQVFPLQNDRCDTKDRRHRKKDLDTLDVSMSAATLRTVQPRIVDPLRVAVHDEWPLCSNVVMK